jgi:hypothetical protein
MSGAKSSRVNPVADTRLQEQARRARDEAARERKRREEAAAAAERARREAERRRREEERRRRRAASIDDARTARTGAASFGRQVVDHGEIDESPSIDHTAEVPAGDALEHAPGNDSRIDRTGERCGEAVDDRLTVPVEQRSGRTIRATVAQVPSTPAERQAEIEQILGRARAGLQVDDETLGRLVAAATQAERLNEWQEVCSRARSAVDDVARSGALAAARAAEREAAEREEELERQERAEVVRAERAEAERLCGSLDGLTGDEVAAVAEALDEVVNGDRSLDEKLRNRVTGCRQRAEETAAARSEECSRAYELLASLGVLESVELKEVRRDLQSVIDGTLRLDAALEGRTEAARARATRAAIAAVLGEHGIELIEDDAAASWRASVPLDDQGGSSLVVIDAHGLSVIAAHDRSSELNDDERTALEHRNCQLADRLDQLARDRGLATERFVDWRPGQLAHTAQASVNHDREEHDGSHGDQHGGDQDDEGTGTGSRRRQRTRRRGAEQDRVQRGER